MMAFGNMGNWPCASLLIRDRDADSLSCSRRWHRWHRAWRLESLQLIGLPSLWWTVRTSPGVPDGLRWHFWHFQPAFALMRCAISFQSLGYSLWFIVYCLTFLSISRGHSLSFPIALRICLGVALRGTFQIVSLGNTLLPAFVFGLFSLFLVGSYSPHLRFICSGRCELGKSKGLCNELIGKVFSFFPFFLRYWLSVFYC